MKKYLLFLTLCLSLFATACKEEKPEEGATIILPRFTISADQLVDWSETENSVRLKLDDDAAAEFAAFTTENKDKKIDIYYGERKLMSPFIQDPATSADIYLNEVEGDIKAGIVSALPPDKKITP